MVLCKTKHKPYLEDAFLLVTPQFRRLQSFTFIGTPDILRNLSKHFKHPTPLLKELTIDTTEGQVTAIDSTFSNADLSSLRVLKLTGVITHLPWNHLPNLTTFELSCVQDSGISVVQLLNFFEGAPHLRAITLCDSIPATSNAPPPPPNE